MSPTSRMRAITVKGRANARLVSENPECKRTVFQRRQTSSIHQLNQLEAQLRQAGEEDAPLLTQTLRALAVVKKAQGKSNEAQQAIIEAIELAGQHSPNPLVTALWQALDYGFAASSLTPATREWIRAHGDSPLRVALSDETKHDRECLVVLIKLGFYRLEWHYVNHRGVGDVPSVSSLHQFAGDFRTLTCPDGGEYKIGGLNESARCGMLPKN